MWSVELSDDQRAALDRVAATHGLGEAARADLEVIARLRNLEAQWRADRLAVISIAADLVDSGRASLATILRALDISPSTWTRRRAELRSALAGTHPAGVTAAGDQAEAGAREAVAQHSKWQEGKS